MFTKRENERGTSSIFRLFLFLSFSTRNNDINPKKKKRRVENSFHFGNRQKISSTKVNVMCYEFYVKRCEVISLEIKFSFSHRMVTLSLSFLAFLKTMLENVNYNLTSLKYCYFTQFSFCLNLKCSKNASSNLGWKFQRIIKKETSIRKIIQN